MQIGKETNQCARENLIVDLERQNKFLKPEIKSFKTKQTTKSFKTVTLIELFY